jgi:AP-1 complex subunit mu
MIFQIFLLDVKGKVLVSRNYRGEIDSSVIDKFMPLLMEKGELFLKISI